MESMVAMNKKKILTESETKRTQIKIIELKYLV